MLQVINLQKFVYRL